MRTFSAAASSRNNHFNLMRVVAAMAVLIGHNGMLINYVPPWEGFLIHYGTATGVIAVDVFFVISGFLVTASLFNRGSTVAFLSARFLRIFPGLWAMLILVVFGLGLALTTESARAYLASPVTWRFLWRWGTIVNGFANFLPGLFEHNPAEAKVNGSLWTITVEWRLYMILAVGWFALGFARTWRAVLFRAAIPLVALALFVRLLFAADVDGGAQHSYFFFAGSTIYLLGDRIRVSSRVILPLLALLAVALIDTRAFFIAYLAVVPLLTLNLAYAPGERLLQFNRIGDYSYGLYIYAYPITQALIAIHPGVTFGALNLLSVPLTLIPAALSWRLIEKPALARKQALALVVSRGLTGLRAFAQRLARAKDQPARTGERP